MVERCQQEHGDPVEAVMDHVKASGAGAVIVAQSGQLRDDDLRGFLDAGWTWSEQVEYVSGRRIRLLLPPKAEQ